MRRRPFLLAALYGGLMVTGACSRGPEVEPSPGGTQGAALPRPARAAGMTLSAALARRRSVREYAEAPLSRSEIGQLMWAAQGITSEGGLRTAPSAGALHPLAVHVAHAGGLYRYEAAGHRISRASASDLRAGLAEAAFGQAWVARAPAVFALSGDVSRSAPRYGGRAERYMLLEAGHAAQNLLLQAVALGLRGTPVGAFDDDELHRLLSLPEAEQPIYLLPVGRPRVS